MSNAFLNGVTINRSDLSPESYTAIPEVNSLSGLGRTNPLVDVSSFDSTGREYIAGLADGTEITMECNFLPGNAVQDAIIADVEAGNNFLFQVVATNPVDSAVDTFAMTVTALGWELQPSFDEKNTVVFTFKISGSITITSS